MSDSNHTPPLDIHDVIERMRAKPAMWLGSRSLQELFVWLAGYRTALLDARQELHLGEPSFDHFHRFVQKKLGFAESTSGWANMICDGVRDDDGPALQRFYELFDEFRALGPAQRIAETSDLSQIAESRGTSSLVDKARGTRNEELRLPTQLELFRLPPPLGVFLIMRFSWGTEEHFVAGEEDGYVIAERWFGVPRHAWRRVD